MSGYKERMELLEKQRQAQRSYFQRACDALAVRIARRGAAVLEAEKPGSVGRLDLKTLDIANAQTCALGQTYGNYNSAPSRLTERGARYGFGKGQHFLFGLLLVKIDFEDLNVAWRKVAMEFGARPA